MPFSFNVKGTSVRSVGVFVPEAKTDLAFSFAGASIVRSAETGPTRGKNPAELHLLPDLFFKPENVLNL